MYLSRSSPALSIFLSSLHCIFYSPPRLAPQFARLILSRPIDIKLSNVLTMATYFSVSMSFGVVGHNSHQAYRPLLQVGILSLRPSVG